MFSLHHENFLIDTGVFSPSSVFSRHRACLLVRARVFPFFVARSPCFLLSSYLGARLASSDPSGDTLHANVPLHRVRSMHGTKQELRGPCPRWGGRLLSNPPPVLSSGLFSFWKRVLLWVSDHLAVERRLHSLALWRMRASTREGDTAVSTS